MKRPLTRFKIGEMFLGLVGLRTQGCRWISSRSEGEDRGLVSQRSPPIPGLRHQMSYASMRRDHQQTLCEQQGCLFHLGAGGLSPRKESAKGGRITISLYRFGIGGGVRSNVLGAGGGSHKVHSQGWGELQRNFLRVGEIIKNIDQLGWGRNKSQWWNVIS